MIDNTYEPSDETESLCFLALGFKQQGNDYVITCWEACFTHANRITKKIACHASFEKCCLTDLIQQLIFCETWSVPVITYRSVGMRILRTRMLINNIPMVSIQGLHHICMQQILEDYFFFPKSDHNHTSIVDLAETMNIKTTDATLTELLSEIFARMQPLLPTGVI